MQLRVLPVAFLVFLAGCVGSPPREVVVRAGRLVDGSGQPAQEKMRLTIRDGSIVAVEPDSEPFDAAGAAVIDARKLTVMPGLVTAHSHLLASESCAPCVNGGALQAVQNLHALLQAGVTTVADLGAPAPLAVAVRRHVGTARHRGPRVLVTGPMLTAPNGYPIDLLGRESVLLAAVVEVGSSEQATEAVRRIAAAEVDAIKVVVQEVGFDRAPLPMLEGETLCAVVKEAHNQELRVLAHAETERGRKAALDCGVDVLLHEALQLAHVTKPDDSGHGATCFALSGSPLQKLLRLERSGLTPLEVLEVASRSGAQILNLHDALGLLKVGYRADLIAVAGKPDEQLADIAYVRHVMIDGVEQRLDGPGLFEKVAAALRLGWAWGMN